MKAKIYTKTGDQGTTSLVGGERVAKQDPRLEAYGTVDELNSAIGMAVAQLPQEARFTESIAMLHEIQNTLFNIGSRLACEDAKSLVQMPLVTESHVQTLEVKMDEWEASLPGLTNFILPGGALPSATLQLCRTICRRAERRVLTLAATTLVEPVVIIYLNRLSDFLFTMARKINSDFGVRDILWKK
jgi:cob(I)alamin adenosyltransferase